MGNTPPPRINDPSLYAPLEKNQGWAALGLATSPLIPADYDALGLAYDGSGNLSQVTYQKNGVVIMTLLLVYNGDNNLIYVGKM